jgi:hypothetical protein
LTCGHQFVEQERDAAERIITSDTGKVRPRIAAMIVELIEDEVRAGNYERPVEPATLGYAIVRLGEAPGGGRGGPARGLRCPQSSS